MVTEIAPNWAAEASRHRVAEVLPVREARLDQKSYVHRKT
jgi:hypothetical protein